MDMASLFVLPFFLVFCRLGAAILVFPGLSDDAIPARTRLLVALGASLLIFPLVQAGMPSLPKQTSTLVMLIGAELIIGLLMGLGARLFMAALSVAGELVAFAAGLQAATLFDPSSQSSTGAPTIFLTLSGGLIVLSLGLHHDLIRAIAQSYAAFPVGVLPPVAGVTAAVVKIFADFSALGLQLAAPMVVAGLLTTALFGLLNRLIPQLQVFFISVPISVVVVMVLFIAAIPQLMEVWAAVVAERISIFATEVE
jgi:flagellar biosynthetic protein FliR